ncbi:MAG: aminotransferase class IV [Flavobacteriales bacterium]|nr:aminotransferase class IV [Flavobacteriales bacterium]
MAKFNQPDPRNASTQCWVDGLVARDEAKVHVLDSVVQGGDAVWEGLRITEGKAIQLEEHLDRLLASAHALAFADIPERDAVRNAIFSTLEANGMRDGVHCRITLSRGRKSTSGMDPRLNVHGPTLIVVPEYKGMVYGDEGIRLITSAIRRNSPQFLDSHIHHNNLLNNILAKIEANVAGMDDAIMLDDRGFLAETNATNLFLVRGGELLTPFAHACLPGLTRKFVLDTAAEAGIPAREADLTLTELYTADEAFTTGTMGALAHIVAADGRRIASGNKGPLTTQLQQRYNDYILETAVALPF